MGKWRGALSHSAGGELGRGWALAGGWAVQNQAHFLGLTSHLISKLSTSGRVSHSCFLLFSLVLLGSTAPARMYRDKTVRLGRCRGPEVPGLCTLPGQQPAGPDFHLTFCSSWAVSVVIRIWQAEPVCPLQVLLYTSSLSRRLGVTQKLTAGGQVLVTWHMCSAACWGKVSMDGCECPETLLTPASHWLLHIRTRRGLLSKIQPENNKCWKGPPGSSQ